MSLDSDAFYRFAGPRTDEPLAKETGANLA